jgi:hypothetical protein
MEDNRKFAGDSAVALVGLHREHRFRVPGIAMQITGSPKALSSVVNQIDVGPVSMPMRTAPGAFNFRNFAIAPGCESTTPSHKTLPIPSTIQIDVFFNEASKPT